MNLIEAIEKAKEGKLIFRKQWLTRGQLLRFLVYQKGCPQGISCDEQTAQTWKMYEGELFTCNPYLQAETIYGEHVMYDSILKFGNLLHGDTNNDWEFCNDREQYMKILELTQAGGYGQRTFAELFKDWKGE